MLNNTNGDLPTRSLRLTRPGSFSIFALVLCAAASLFLTSGCKTSKAGGDSNAEDAAIAKAMSSATATNSDLLVLHEGDTLAVTFPGAPDLNTVAVIRRDGRITLKSLGEFKAAGLTPPEMEKQLIQAYGSQLQTKEVTVAVQSSAFPVYVTGAVLRPGKILSDRPLTALEAIMEAGGFDYTKANLKAVRILRTEDGRTVHYTVNLKAVLQGQGNGQFNLKPADIIYVPEKFNLF